MNWQQVAYYYPLAIEHPHFRVLGVDDDVLELVSRFDVALHRPTGLAGLVLVRPFMRRAKCVTDRVNLRTGALVETDAMVLGCLNRAEAGPKFRTVAGRTLAVEWVALWTTGALVNELLLFARADAVPPEFREQWITHFLMLSEAPIWLADEARWL